MSRLGATTTPFPTRASARGQISERATPLSRSGLPEGALPPIPGSGRPHGRWPCRTGPPHMPPELAHAERDDARMPRRSREAGPNTHAVASRVLADARMRGQGHDPALAVPDPSRRYGEEAPGSACGCAPGRSEHPRRRLVCSVPAGNVAAGGPEKDEGGHVRGAGHCEGGG